MKTTMEIADLLGVKRSRILKIIDRHPELRPAYKIKSGRRGVYLWTDEEVERLEKYIRRGDDAANQ